MKIFGFLLIISIVLLQEGSTFYLSFQVLALVILGLTVALTATSLRFKLSDVSIFLAFALICTFKSFFSPLVISTNSSNIFLSTLAILIYAFAIFFMSKFYFSRPAKLLSMLRDVSGATILVLAGIFLISESSITSYLTREIMVQQNARLIDNFNNADAIFAEQAYRIALNESEPIDLFYGEPSFLAIVLFACLGCYMVASKLISGLFPATLNRTSKIRDNFVPAIAIIFLLCIGSFSSLIYAIVATYYLFIKQGVDAKHRTSSALFVLVFGIIFSIFSYRYFVYRLTMGESVSFDQRFGLFFKMDLVDLLGGISDAALLPEFGIHNGVIYILAISGIAGAIYLFSLLRSVYKLATTINLGSFCVLVILAIAMQNGAVFSPSKVVLLSLILIPLGCSRTVNCALKPTDSHGVACV